MRDAMTRWDWNAPTPCASIVWCGRSVNRFGQRLSSRNHKEVK